MTALDNKYQTLLLIIQQTSCTQFDETYLLIKLHFYASVQCTFVCLLFCRRLKISVRSISHLKLDQSPTGRRLDRCAVHLTAVIKNLQMSKTLIKISVKLQFPKFNDLKFGALNRVKVHLKLHLYTKGCSHFFEYLFFDCQCIENGSCHSLL